MFGKKMTTIEKFKIKGKLSKKKEVMILGISDIILQCYFVEDMVDLATNKNSYTEKYVMGKDNVWETFTTTIEKCLNQTSLGRQFLKDIDYCLENNNFGTLFTDHYTSYIDTINKRLKELAKQVNSLHDFKDIVEGNKIISEISEYTKELVKQANNIFLSRIIIEGEERTEQTFDENYPLSKLLEVETSLEKFVVSITLFGKGYKELTNYRKRSELFSKLTELKKLCAKTLQN